MASYTQRVESFPAGFNHRQVRPFLEQSLWTTIRSNPSILVLPETSAVGLSFPVQIVEGRIPFQCRQMRHTCDLHKRVPLLVSWSEGGGFALFTNRQRFHH